MTPLIDADILLHELSWSGEFKDKETGEVVLLPFEHVQELLDDKIRLICEDVGATTKPILFLTNSEWITNYLNKRRKYMGGRKAYYVPGFRYDVATTKPYKGTRTNPKPFHFYNITMYLLEKYITFVSESGNEADDQMCMFQTDPEVDYETIICSRDKDLRICPGWHFSWECGKQAAVGPVETDEIGWLTLLVKESVNKTNGKVTKTRELKGYGLKFFFSQLLTGDTADNIPGLPGVGAVAAFNLLNELTTEEHLFKAVQEKYKEVMGDEAREYFKEQKSLLWMKQTNRMEYTYVG